MKPEKQIRRYLKYYNNSAFNKKLSKISGKLGNQLLLYLVVLHDLVRDKNIPTKVRLIFIAALGYFILPTDLVSDFLPALGFTDDLAFITYAISTASGYITPEIWENARIKTDKILKRESDDSVSESA